MEMIRVPLLPMIWSFLFLLLSSVSLMAHPGHETGTGFGSSFASGWTHPLFGWDHLIAMVAVGLWALQTRMDRAWWVFPMSFVVAMGIGFGFGLQLGAFPLMEWGIKGSIFILGMLLLAQVKSPLLVGCVVLGVFGGFHGWAHGAELTAGSSAAGFAMGFLACTLILHATGVAVAWGVTRVQLRPVLRTMGAACIAALFIL